MKTEWKKYKLGDIGKIVGGATPSTKNSDNYINGTIPWITPKDLANHFDRYISHGERNITESGLKSCSAQLMPAHSILFSSRAPIGYIAISANEVCTNQGFKSIVPNEKVDYMFLYYLLKFNKDRIEHIGSGTTFKEVSGTVMKNFEITIPPLPVQKKIAGILKSLDDKIELNRQISKNLEEQAWCLFDKTFLDSHKGKNKISDYILPQKGKNLQSKDAVPGSVPVVAGGLNPATYHNVANTSAPVITISASGANAGYVNLWNIPVWSSDSSYIDNSVTTSVYFWYILLKKRQNEIFDAQTGSAQPHIYPSHIGNMPMCSVSQEKMEKFHIQVTPLFELIGKNILENQKLSSLRDTLLPKLMSGEIEV